MKYNSERIAEALRLRQRTPILVAPSPVRGDVHIQVERCKGCELCIECCPAHVLRVSDDYNDAGYHHPVVIADECVCCQACYTICPDFAIFATLRGSDPEGGELGGAAMTAMRREASAEVRR